MVNAKIFFVINCSVKANSSFKMKYFLVNVIAAIFLSNVIVEHILMSELRKKVKILSH